MDNYSEELEVALKAAREAGKIMDKHAMNGVKVKDTKRDVNDIVTYADIKAQRKIVEAIRGEFPNDGFLGEEEGLDSSERNRVWIIDPIDGTSNFKNGFKYYATSIALEVDNSTKVAVILSPSSALGTVHFGVEDCGARKMHIEENKEDSEEVSVSSQQNIESSMLQLKLSDTDKERRTNDIEIIEGLMDEGAKYRRPGAAAPDLCQVSTGNFDGSIEWAYKWDFAAGKLLIQEAGGKVSIKKLGNNRERLIASNGNIQEELEKVVQTKSINPE